MIGRAFLSRSLAVAVVLTSAAVRAEGPAHDHRADAEDRPDVVIEGTVSSIKVGEGSGLERWIVTMNVAKVRSGDFSERTFTFAVHRPTVSRLKVGHPYWVRASWYRDEYGVNDWPWEADRKAPAPVQEVPLSFADVDPSDGIDDREAMAIAWAYFSDYGLDCEGPDKVLRRGRTWVVSVWTGLTGEQRGDSIRVDARTGAVWSADSPRFRSFAAFRDHRRDPTGNSQL